AVGVVAQCHPLDVEGALIAEGVSELLGDGDFEFRVLPDYLEPWTLVTPPPPEPRIEGFPPTVPTLVPHVVDAAFGGLPSVTAQVELPFRQSAGRAHTIN